MTAKSSAHDVMQPQVIICRTGGMAGGLQGWAGASDAACPLPWKTNVQLWEEKCGLVIPEDIGDKPLCALGGNDAEPFAALLLRP